MEHQQVSYTDCTCSAELEFVSRTRPIFKSQRLFAESKKNRDNRTIYLQSQSNGTILEWSSASLKSPS